MRSDAVGVPVQTRVGQLAPDRRQFQPRAKQVDALAAGHFRCRAGNVWRSAR